MADLKWAVPDYTTLCRRQKTLAVQIPYRRAEGPLNLLVKPHANAGDEGWHKSYPQLFVKSQRSHAGRDS